MMMKTTLLLLLLPIGLLTAGPYPPAAGEEGSEAIALDDPRVVQWASLVSDYAPGEDVDEMWQDSEQALGKAEGTHLDIVCLGRGGEITLEFSPPIKEGPGPDFAVFENSFSDSFLELAYVEVSTDGLNFFRFENASLTQSPVGPFGSLDTTDVDGLAGKYRQGFGTPFDLSDLGATPGLDRSKVRFVRLKDVVGGTSLDSSGRIIYDPWPGSGAAGFDLDAIAVLKVGPPQVLTAGIDGGNFSLSWTSQPGARYRIEASSLLDFDSWNEVAKVEALSPVSELAIPLGASGRLFYRVVLDEATD